MCPHSRIRPEVVDQTLGVVCADCDTLVQVCWMDSHVPELVWNNACAAHGDEGFKRCEQSRDDFCGICGEYIP
jgi:hypothetical protein